MGAPSHSELSTGSSVHEIEHRPLCYSSLIFVTDIFAENMYLSLLPINLPLALKISANVLFCLICKGIEPETKDSQSSCATLPLI